jgi:tetratricopeptide (TPR) repeat protein
VNDRIKFLRVVNAMECVIFLGAGASHDSGLPLGNTAARFILHTAFNEMHQARAWTQLNRQIGDEYWPRFEVVLETLSKYIPGAPIEMISCFAGIGLSSTQKFLANLGSGPKLWLTTNFDDQIERALADLPFRVVTERNEMRELRASDLKQHLIIKLHGDFTSKNLRESLGVRISEILRAFPIDARDALLRLCANRSIMFVGYAARDPDLIGFVERVVQGAREVCWVGRGKASDAVTQLATANRQLTYFPGGFRRSVREAFRVEMPRPCRCGLAWEECISNWVKRQGKNELLQFIAQICLDLNHPVSRRRVVMLDSLIESADPQHLLWKLEREFDCLARSPRIKFQDMELIERQARLITSRRTHARAKVKAEALTALGILYHRTGDLDKAEGALVRAEILSRRTRDAVTEINSLRWLGHVQVYRGDFQCGLQNLKNARTLAHKSGEGVLEVTVSLALAVGYMRANKANQAEQIIRQIGRGFNEIGNPRHILNWKLNLAEALRIQRRFREAIDIYDDVLREAHLQLDDEVTTNATVNRGLCLTSLGVIADADRAFAEATRKCSGRIAGEERGNAIYNRGWLRVLLGLWSEAVIPLNEAARCHRKSAMAEREASALLLVAWCELRLGHVKTAKKIVGGIKGRQIVPTGLFEPDFKLLEFALRSDLSRPALFLSLVNRQFASDPEQRFYLFAWVLESTRVADSRSLRNATLKGALEAIKQAGLGIYASLLLHMIGDMRIQVPKYIRSQLNDLSPGIWETLCQKLPRFS